MSDFSAVRILAVDDDPGVLVTVRASLEAEGLEVTAVTSAAEALRAVDRLGLPHLAVVDIVMPGTDGLALARELLTFSDLPIVFLTSVADEKTVVASIEEVAEDYIVKPFNPRELAARVKRILRRLGDFAFTLSPLTEVDSRLSVDFAGQTAIVDGREVALTPTETKILHILLRNAPRAVQTGFLLRRLWPREDVYEDVLRVHIHRLRRKVEPEPSRPRHVVTVRGLGYRLNRG